MAIALQIAVAGGLGLVAGGSARAEHHHDGGPHHHDGDADAAAVGSSFGAGVQLVAARFDTDLYLGDYQGVTPSVTWARGRFGATANLGVYRLTENGRRLYGVGDTVLTGQATLVDRGPVMLGVAFPVSLPTGDQLTGLGMGHVMVMPAVWASSSFRRITVGAAVGYGRALGAGEAHHDHGAWPLVDPMNMVEVTWSANAYVSLGQAIRAGVRMSGGVPIGDGHDRVVGGVRAMWTEGRVETGFEVQAGFAGDPFILRGLLESAVRF